MTLTDKLTAIATAIRARTGKSALMTLDQMPTEIASIEDHEIEDALLTNALSGEYTNDRVTYISSDALRYRTNMTAINFPNAITLFGRAFHTCTRLVAVNCPKVATINTQAFSNCALVNASFPKIENIGAQVFQSCVNLEWLSFDDITEVPTLSNVNAFQGCSSLEAFYFPDALVAAAKTTTNWSTFEDIILPLSQKPAA